MIYWILYLAIDGDFIYDHPYHFAFKSTCEEMGQKMVKDYKYEKFKCIKEVPSDKKQ